MVLFRSPNCRSTSESSDTAIHTKAIPAKTPAPIPHDGQAKYPHSAAYMPQMATPDTRPARYVEQSPDCIPRHHDKQRKQTGASKLATKPAAMKLWGAT